MQFGLTEEQQKLRLEWREFVQEVCPREYVRELDGTGEFPDAFFEKLVERGWLMMPFPQEFGGRGGMSSLDQVLVFEELAHQGFSLALAVSFVWLFGFNSILEFGTKEQKEYYFPRVMAGKLKLAFAMTEPDSGSDITRLSTFAEQKGDRFIINGAKIFITAAEYCERIALITRTVKDAPPQSAYTVFLLDPKAPGVTMNKLKALGRHSPGHYEVGLDNVEMGVEDILGGINNGWKTLQRGLEHERTCASAMYLGNTQAAIDDTVAFVLEHKENGKPLAQSQMVRHYIADMQARTDAARLLIYRAAGQISAKIPSFPQVCMAKLFSSENYVYVTDLAMRILGDHAYTNAVDVQRYFRDARSSTIGAGTSEIQRTLIANSILG